MVLEKTILAQNLVCSRAFGVFKGDVVYEFKETDRKPTVNDQFRKITRQYKDIAIMPVMIYSYGFLFNCTMVGQASDSMTTLM